jgi:hypothetical protein
MKACPQTESQSVLEHGFSVKNYTMDLLNHLELGTPLKYEWKLPEWIYEEKDFILQHLENRKTLKTYTIMHDCGKPLCLQIDEEGKRHFPNHAEISFQTFVRFYDDPVAAQLILHDMDIHTLKSEGVEEFSKSPYAITHLIVGLAEIHSNAKMFGGIDSTSFKIKHKCISKRGKQIINLTKNNQKTK